MNEWIIRRIVRPFERVVLLTRRYIIVPACTVSAKLAELIVKLSVCLCVNQGGTNHNRYTWRLVILHGDLDSPRTIISPNIFSTGQFALPTYIFPPTLRPGQLSVKAHGLFVNGAITGLVSRESCHSRTRPLSWCLGCMLLCIIFYVLCMFCFSLLYFPYCVYLCIFMYVRQYK